MGLTEDEIEARLAVLRRRREALDREIADLVLYLELGRRLSGTGDASAAPAPAVPRSPEAAPAPSAGPQAGPPAGPGARRPDPARPGASPAEGPPPAARPPAGPAAPAPPRAGGAEDIPPAIAFTDDPAGARRYGRALVAAACAAIGAAGRPLHAGEILETLRARGFALPGRDPVAALNTRLWKRAAPGGPLRRVAEATYALADPPS